MSRKTTRKGWNASCEAKRRARAEKSLQDRRDAATVLLEQEATAVRVTLAVVPVPCKRDAKLPCKVMVTPLPPVTLTRGNGKLALVRRASVRKQMRRLLKGLDQSPTARPMRPSGWYPRYGKRRKT